MDKRDRLSISITAMALGIFLAACQTTSGTESAAPNVKGAVGPEVAKLDVPVSEQASFALSRVVSGIQHGTPIVNFPLSGVDGTEGSLCNLQGRSNRPLLWTGRSSQELGNWASDLGEVFFEVFDQQGFNITGDPQDLFGREKSVQGAEYLIGGRITGISGNICRVHQFWEFRNLGIFSGEMTVKVEWAVFSSLLNKEVFRLKTKGYAKQVDAQPNGIILAFHSAFANAAEQLASNAKFRDIALRRAEPEQKTAAKDILTFDAAELRTKSLEKDIDSVLSAVVTIRLGAGHGSGFVISEDGLILTNAHVVGDAKIVSIVLSNGLEIEGKVIRRHDKRDVAAIRSPIRVPNALPIRLNTPKPLEKVFAIGSPLRVELKSTITSGIISAFRHDERTGLRFIQSDAAISPGNSGGPLLDQNGNVVGLSVATIVGPRADSLHLFIPIDEALEALALKPTPPAS